MPTIDLKQYFFHNLVLEWFYLIMIHSFILFLISLHRGKSGKFIISMLLASEFCLVLSNSFSIFFNFMKYIPIPFLVLSAVYFFKFISHKTDERKEALDPAYLILIMLFPISYLLPVWSKTIGHTTLYLRIIFIIPFLAFLLTMMNVLFIYSGRFIGRLAYPWGSIFTSSVFIVITILILFR
ncbi:MAG: hypothetical protein JXA60_08510 [Candidatus Coatesbacteria bacterium]|nr:hypothetical protein [Candidatus Coatesbacteria bacterium]